MRKLVMLTIVAAIAWGGYWFIGSSAVETGLSTWLTQRQSDGWVAEYSQLKTRGFPNRFDTTISDLELADPRTGVAWTAPFLKILALSYKPNHIIAILPPRQTIASPHERLEISNQTMRGSVVFDAGTALTLNRSSFVLEDFALNSDLGWSAGIKSGQVSTRQSVATPNAHDIYFEALGARPSDGLLATMDPAGLLPKVIQNMTLDTSVTFDAPWDRFAIEQARPQITTLDLKLLRATWGNLDLRAAGELSVDADGLPTGSITIKAKNWRDMLKIAVSSGVIPPEISTTVERALELLAGMSGNPKTLDAPLSFKKGYVSFGPIPLGRAPRLVIR